MDNQKLEPILNLALSTREAEREKSGELNTGFDEASRQWELIVRYHGQIEYLRRAGIEIVYLINYYAILTVPQNQIPYVLEAEEIIYVEQPKRVFFEVTEGRRVSCIDQVQVSSWHIDQPGLFGEGVLCAVIDSGIDYNHPAFKNADGTTRILRLWDQSVSSGTPPQGYTMGSLYTEQDINEALAAGSQREMYGRVPSRDLSGHGTHVAGIMAGNFAANRNNNLGIATKSSLLVVKLGNARGGFPRTSELMQAVNYVIEEALALNMPISINMSFGNNYGSHDGTSLLETFLDTAIDVGRTSLSVGSGNEGIAAGHTGGFLSAGQRQKIELGVGEFQTAFSVQLWKEYADRFDIEISAPGFTTSIRVQNQIGPQRYNLEGTSILLYYGEPSPYSQFQEIYLDFIPDKEFVAPGIWTIFLIPAQIVVGRYDLWLPVNGVLNAQTKFLEPDPETTLTIPSTSSKAITVGAYDSFSEKVAGFSGRGYTRLLEQIKPDIVAPGVNISSAATGGGREVRSGTSMATPFVSGSAALLMEWGIVRGNDRFLYGEKVKAYLIRGAKPLAGEPVPSRRQGFGALCLRDSLPV